jgi:hypothetical protein
MQGAINTQISRDLIAGAPSLPHCISVCDVDRTLLLTFCKNRLVLVVLVTIKIFGPIPGNIGEIDRTNLEQKLMLASSTSLDDRKDPSPSLFSDDKGGNSHSINGNDGVRGDANDACIDAIALLSLFQTCNRQRFGWFVCGVPPNRRKEFGHEINGSNISKKYRNN